MAQTYHLLCITFSTSTCSEKDGRPMQALLAKITSSAQFNSLMRSLLFADYSMSSPSLLPVKHYKSR